MADDPEAPDVPDVPDVPEEQPAPAEPEPAAEQAADDENWGYTPMSEWGLDEGER